MSASEMTAALDAELSRRPEMSGFNNVKPRLWVSLRKEPIREIVQFVPVRYEAYRGNWGFALAFAPTLGGGNKLSWKRTEKATKPDVWVDPADNPELNFGSYGISYSKWRLGADGQVHDRLPEFASVRHVVDAVLLAAGGLFDSVNSFADLLKVFEQIPSRKSTRFGPDNYVPHGLGWGLSQIAAGVEAEGRRRCEKWRDSFKVNAADPIFLKAIELARQNAENAR